MGIRNTQRSHHTPLWLDPQRDHLLVEGQALGARDGGGQAQSGGEPQRLCHRGVGGVQVRLLHIAGHAREGGPVLGVAIHTDVRLGPAACH